MRGDRRPGRGRRWGNRRGSKGPIGNLAGNRGIVPFRGDSGTGRASICSKLLRGTRQVHDGSGEAAAPRRGFVRQVLQYVLLKQYVLQPGCWSCRKCG